MLNVQSSSSLHETIREEIGRRVSSGAYAVGEAIPSTAILSKEFNVSPITIKRALRDLQAAGALISIPGKGTFVKEQRRFIRELDVWMTSLENAKKLGFQPSLELISITKEKITDPTFDVFPAPKEAMLCVHKTILADDIPIMFDASYLPASMDNDLVDLCGEKFVADVLADFGLPILNTRLVIDAAPASPGAQQVFSIPNGYPTLRRLYHLMTADPNVSVFGVVESPFDRLACSVNLPALQTNKESNVADIGVAE